MCDDSANCTNLEVCFPLIKFEKICVEMADYQESCYGVEHKSTCKPQFVCQNSKSSCHTNQTYHQELDFCVSSKHKFLS